MIWAKLSAFPDRGFYVGAVIPDSAPAISYDRLLSVGAIRWASSIGGGDEAANCSIVIDNGDAEMTAEFSGGILNQPMSIYDDTAAIFTGLIDRISLGPEIRLDLVADGLSQLVELRRTTVWSAPFVDAVIPHIIGKQTIQPIRYSADGRRWVLADHACAGVLAVSMDGKAVAGAAMANTQDELGHAIAVLRLNEAVADGQELLVKVQGLMNTAGELAQNPAEVIEYLVSTVGGQGITAAQLDRFRAECAAEPIKLNMVFDDDGATYRAEIDRIMQNAGGIWSPGLTGFARLWPLAAIPAAEPNYLVLPDSDAFGDADSSLDDIATELTIEFDYEPARDLYRQSVTLKAQASEDSYGKRASTMQAGALSTRREALRLGQRLLPYLARPRWQQQATIAGDDAVALPPGVFVNITATHLPIAGQVLVTGVTREYETNGATIELEQPYGPAPAVALVQSSQLANAAEQATTITYQDGVATITALAPDGSVLPGAAISLDGIVRTADAQGRSRFVIDPGIYELRITADGYEEQIISDFRVGL